MDMADTRRFVVHTHTHTHTHAHTHTHTHTHTPRGSLLEMHPFDACICLCANTDCRKRSENTCMDERPPRSWPEPIMHCDLVAYIDTYMFAMNTFVLAYIYMHAGDLPIRFHPGRNISGARFHLVRPDQN